MKKYLASMSAAIAFCALALMATPAAAAACNTTLFSSTQGDVVFPMCPPKTNVPTPGQLDNMDIGQNTQGKLGGSQLTVDSGTKTATATGTTTATATLNKNSGVITSASLTTAAGGTYVLTLTNSVIAANDLVFASVATAGTGTPVVASVVEGAGQVVITIQNIHASAAFNNVLKLKFMVLQN